MTTDRWLRASDLDRERAAERLRDAYAAGGLSRAEFDERCLAVYSARTYGELRDLTADLPAPPAAALPSEAVIRPGMTRNANRRALGLMASMCLLVLAAGLAGRILPAAVWITATMAMVPLLLAAWAPGGPQADRCGRRRRVPRQGADLRWRRGNRDHVHPAPFGMKHGTVGQRRADGAVRTGSG